MQHEEICLPKQFHDEEDKIYNDMFNEFNSNCRAPELKDAFHIRNVASLLAALNAVATIVNRHENRINELELEIKKLNGELN